MIYQLYEYQRAMWEPWRAVTAYATGVAASLPPAVTESPSGRAMLASLELFERLTRERARPDFGISETSVDGQATPVQVRAVWERPFCTLTHFDRGAAAKRRGDPRLLVVAPLSGHFATLLRDTVDALLPEHEVYIADWHNARDVPPEHGAFDLDDYIDYVMEMLHHLGPDTHVLAVCQPVVPVVAAVSLLAAADDPDQPRSMTLMAGPVDARQSPTAVNEFATSRSLAWFKQHAVTSVPARFPGAGRRVYPGFVQLAAFMSMNTDRHVESHAQFVDDLLHGREEHAERHRRFYDEYFSVMDLPAEYYLQTVDLVFQRYALAKGELVSRGRRVDPSAIRRTALMTIEGERDDISGLGQTRAAHDLCTGVPAELRSHHEQPGVGHYGVFSGRRWRAEVMPRIRDFVQAVEFASAVAS